MRSRRRSRSARPRCGDRTGPSYKSTSTIAVVTRCAWRSTHGLAAASGRRDVPDVQPALPFGGFFPPPSSGAFMFTGQNGARARLTSNRDEPALMECVVGNRVVSDVLPCVRRGPPREGIQLDERPRAADAGERPVDLDHGDVRARRRALVAPLSRRPRAKSRQRSAEWFHLADAAALFVAVVVEAEEPLP